MTPRRWAGLAALLVLGGRLQRASGIGACERLTGNNEVSVQFCRQDDSEGLTACTVWSDSSSSGNKLFQTCVFTPRQSSTERTMWLCAANQEGAFCTQKLKGAFRPVKKFYVDF